MVHGSLTPLGSQLRSVLASLRLPLHTLPTALRLPVSPIDQRTTLGFQTLSLTKRDALATAAAFESNADLSTSNGSAPTSAARQVKDSQLESVRDDREESKYDQARPRHTTGSTGDHRTSIVLDLDDYANIIDGAVIRESAASHYPDSDNGLRRGISGKGRISSYGQGSRFGYKKDLNSLALRITQRYLRHNLELDNSSRGKTTTSFTLETFEKSYLDTIGADHDYVRMWADIVSENNPRAAAELVSQMNHTKGPGSVPAIILIYLLRGPPASAHALRILADQCFRHVGHCSIDETPYWTLDTIFMAFARLIRHARTVWPGGFIMITKLLLAHIEQTESNDQAKPENEKDKLAVKLNKALELIALPTTINPYRDVEIREAAIISILKFMSEHNPALQMSRKGYRAVIAVQLAQRKTPQEQQWAVLKALSWPPWKEERTAMDADITVEEHGTSKAARTLETMRRAGYAFGDWEKVSAIYAGWDTDGTPTIQTREKISMRTAEFESKQAEWIARISSTRTVQEAWASFLAFEEERLPRYQGVYLAIFRKLHSEGKRLQAQRRHHSGDDRQYRLHSGDQWEVEPLPPSTHLYTYTRTAPLTVEKLYMELRGRGIVFSDHCLAFLISNAPSLQQGIRYLIEGEPECPNIRGLISLDPDVDLTLVPNTVFAATVELLSCFQFVPLNKSEPFRENHDRFTAPTIVKFPQDGKLNPQHSLVHAIRLLAHHRPTFRSPWNSVLGALCRNEALTMEHFFLNRNREPLPPRLEKARGAIKAYRVAHRVCTMMREARLEADGASMLSLCMCVENFALGAHALIAHGVEDNFVLAACRTLSHCQHLKTEFAAFVGELSPSTLDSSPWPDAKHMVFLGVPGPPLLHAYIRALGWSADHAGLLVMARWMSQHSAVLAEKRARERNGEVIMRRAVVALRVFLERSWMRKTFSRSPLLEGGDEDEMGEENAMDEDDDDDANAGRQQILRQFRTAASKTCHAGVLALVEQHADDWGGGWPSDDEVAEYCEHPRFRTGLSSRRTESHPSR